MKTLRIRRRGLGISLHDGGRPAWRRFGVPPGGPMDPHAAGWANRLLGNPDDAPVLEILLQGAEFEVLSPCRLALAGADAKASFPLWHARDASPGEIIVFPENRAGLWAYLAVEGGWIAERIMDSVSAYPRGGIGRDLGEGDVLGAPAAGAGRGAAWLWWGERRDYNAPPLIRVWPGPQAAWFDEAERGCFLSAEWTVSSRSDRTGFRLDGSRLNVPDVQMDSEPVVVGTVQVPPNGQPVVTMRDGPTVGGYPKIGVVDPGSLPWLAQCRPGTPFRFVEAE